MASQQQLPPITSGVNSNFTVMGAIMGRSKSVGTLPLGFQQGEISVLFDNVYHVSSVRITNSRIAYR
jgi:hypothetical protein